MGDGLLRGLCARGLQRWRPGHGGQRQPHGHGAAVGAGARSIGGDGLSFSLGLWGWEEGPGLIQLPTRLGQGVETRVANLMEAIGQDVLNEPPQKFDGVQGRGLLAFGAEGDVLGAHIQDPRIGDAHAVGVAAQVAKDVLGAAEGSLGVDDPGLVGREAGHQAVEGRVAEFLESPLSPELPQGVQHLPPQKSAHHLHRKQEVLPNMDKPLAVEGEPTRRDEHMDMGVEAQVPCPGVEYHRQPQRSLEVVSAQFQQQLADGTEQLAVDLRRMPHG